MDPPASVRGGEIYRECWGVMDPPASVREKRSSAKGDPPASVGEEDVDTNPGAPPGWILVTAPRALFPTVLAPPSRRAIPGDNVRIWLMFRARVGGGACRISTRIFAGSGRLGHSDTLH